MAPVLPPLVSASWKRSRLALMSASKEDRVGYMSFDSLDAVGRLPFVDALCIINGHIITAEQRGYQTTYKTP